MKFPACNFARAQIRLYCIVARTRKTGVHTIIGKRYIELHACVQLKTNECSVRVTTYRIPGFCRG